MRKVLAVVVLTSLVLTGCGKSTDSGKGAVIGVDYDPTTYYSKAECLKKFGKSGCFTSRVKDQEDWDITIIDSGSGREREIEVSQEVFATCTPGKIYNGSTC